jgi:hypothetical protein
MVRRAVASKIGDLATHVEHEVVINELIPIFKQLSADEQVIRWNFFVNF